MKKQQKQTVSSGEWQQQLLRIGFLNVTSLLLLHLAYPWLLFGWRSFLFSGICHMVRSEVFEKRCHPWHVLHILLKTRLLTCLLHLLVWHEVVIKHSTLDTDHQQHDHSTKLGYQDKKGNRGSESLNNFWAGWMRDNSVNGGAVS